MKFKLTPQAFIPWKLMDSTALHQDLQSIDSDYTALLPDEGFEWCGVLYGGDKAVRYDQFLATPNLETQLESLFEAAAADAEQSECARLHHGVALADESLNLLTTGLNQRPDYIFGPCDLIGCQPDKVCRTTYTPERVAFHRLRTMPYQPFALVSRLVPALEGINTCELSGVTVIVYCHHRKFLDCDGPVISMKTVKSNLLFLQLSERE